MIVTSIDFMMRDDLTHAECVGDRHGFRQSLEHLFSFVANMRSNDSIRSSQGLAHGLNLVRRRCLCRRVIQTSRDSHCTGIQCFLDKFLHVCDFSLVGRTIQILHGDRAQGGVAGKGRNVDRGGCFLQRFEILLEGVVALSGVVSNQI